LYEPSTLKAAQKVRCSLAFLSTGKCLGKGRTFWQLVATSIKKVNLKIMTDNMGTMIPDPEHKHGELSDEF
jgi:hypothetical protein